MKIGHFRIAGVLLLLAGCAGSSSTYTNPTKTEVSTEKYVETKFDIFWDQYVEKLSESFFVINNISKESRIINVSFSSDKPSNYIDCGTTTRIAKHPSFGERKFTYLTADDSTYQMGIKGTNHLARINRDTSLEGRVNIYMAPKGKNTLLRVNAKYVFSVKTSGIIETSGQITPAQTYSMSFSSKNGTSRTDFDSSSGKSTTWGCSSKGQLEEELLELVQ